MTPAQHKGFTMVELIVTIAVMSILAGMMALSGAESRKVAGLSIAARDVESALKYAQSLGRGGAPAGADDEQKYDRGYGVSVRDGGSKIIIYEGKNDTYIRYDGLAQDFEVRSLPAGVVFEKDVDTHFRRGVTAVSFFPNDNREIVLKSGGATKTVIVENTGLIYTEQL